MRKSLLKKISISIFVLFFGLPVQGADPCAEYAATGIDTIEIATTHQLVACGQNDGNRVNIAHILEVKDEKAKPIFSSNDSLKNYTFQRINNQYILRESLNLADSLPFLETRIVCLNGACNVTESCLWSKTKVDETEIGGVEMQIKRNPPNVSDDQLISLFYAALNGSKKALSLLETNFFNSNVSGTEIQATFRTDLGRLRQAQCL